MIAVPDGYSWAARASVYGLPVTGYDRLSSGCPSCSAIDAFEGLEDSPLTG